MAKYDLVVVVMTWFGIVSGGILIYNYLTGIWMFIALAAWTLVCAEIGRRLQKG